jgi:GrpB-like predicted nucleotidyltransferase (UPF0157 family)
MERVLPYDPQWAETFLIEAKSLTAALHPLAITLHHMGSTAVPGLLAKPVIDILGAVESLDEIDTASSRLSGLGYEVMGAFGIEGRRYFRKTRCDGVRTHHLHVYQEGSSQIPRHLAFRDYLRAHPARAAAYGAVKAAIVGGDHPPGLTYAQAKAGMVAQIKAEAAAWRV